MYDRTRSAFAAAALAFGLLGAAASGAAAQDAERRTADPPVAESAPAAGPAEAPAAPPSDPSARPAPDETAPTSPAPEETPAIATAPPSVDMPSAAIVGLARWVINAGDNGERPFVIIDKLAAEIAVFSPEGRLQGAGPALIGLARGDDSTPGIGDRDLSAIAPEERTTPAGRFLAGYGMAAGGRRVLWVDYADAISLHPVVTNRPDEHRPERLQSASPEDRRITFGCINVAAGFYDEVVRPAFEGVTGVVYILPETRPADEVFPGFGAWTRASAEPQGRLTRAAQ